MKYLSKTDSYAYNIIIPKVSLKIFIHMNSINCFMCIEKYGYGFQIKHFNFLKELWSIMSHAIKK